ncbi:MAG: CPBP family intramembrane glutamic endopeptidase, partial [Microbacteriaceae bacterium]
MQQEPYGYQYHRLFRGMPNYRWWKPLVFAFLAVTFGFTLQVAVTGLAMAPFIAAGDVSSILSIESRIMALDTQDPFAI